MLKYWLFIIGLMPSIGVAEDFPSLGTGRATCDSLWVERNQILNVAGYCFETPLGQAIFDNADCSLGTPALSEASLNRIARLEQAEDRRSCEVNTGKTQVTVIGRYGPLRLGANGKSLGRWLGALQRLDVFPDIIGRTRNCTVAGLSSDGDNFLALRSGPDVRYPQIGQMVNGARVSSSSACMGRWCFADSVQTGNIVEPRNGWFHVRWCQP